MSFQKWKNKKLHVYYTCIIQNKKIINSFYDIKM